jgi:hypothetical protein
MSANIALLIMGLHLAMHWNWIVTTFKRVFCSGAKQQSVTTAKQEM